MIDFAITPRTCRFTAARSAGSSGHVAWPSSVSRFPSVPSTTQVLSRA